MYSKFSVATVSQCPLKKGLTVDLKYHTLKQVSSVLVAIIPSFSFSIAANV